MDLPPYVESLGHGKWRLRVRVAPGAKRNALDGLRQDGLQVRLAAPPVDGKANKALVEFIADALRLRKRDVHIASGEKSRAKTLIIECDEEPAWSKPEE